MRTYTQPKFQHRQYEVIAKAIADTSTRDELIERLISDFRWDNPRFNTDRFEKAAGLNMTRWSCRCGSTSDQQGKDEFCDYGVPV